MTQCFHTPEVLIGYPKSDTGWHAQAVLTSNTAECFKLQENDALVEYANVFRTGWQLSFQNNGTVLVTHADCEMPLMIDANLLALFMAHHPGMALSQVPLKICLNYSPGLMKPSYSLVSEEMLQAMVLLPNWEQYFDHQFIPASQLKEGDVIRADGCKYRLAKVRHTDNQTSSTSCLGYPEEVPNQYRIFDLNHNLQVYRYAETTVTQLDLLITNLAAANKLNGIYFGDFKRTWDAFNSEALEGAMARHQPLGCEGNVHTQYLIPLDRIFDSFTEEMLAQYFQKARTMLISNNGTPVYSTLLNQPHKWYFEISRVRRKGYVKIFAPHSLYEAIYKTAQPEELTYAQAVMFLNAVKEQAWVALAYCHTQDLEHVVREVVVHSAE